MLDWSGEHRTEGFDTTGGAGEMLRRAEREDKEKRVDSAMREGEG